MEVIKIKESLILKIKEHKNEILASQQAIDGIRKKTTLKTKAFADLSDQAKQGVMQLGILKDKVLFHKACLACLQDLLTEIENG